MWHRPHKAYTRGSDTRADIPLQRRLAEPRLPEAHDGVPVIGIECLFRFRQQLLANGFLHGSILSAFDAQRPFRRLGPAFAAWPISRSRPKLRGVIVRP